MTISLNFDTLKSCTPRTVPVTGTVAAVSIPQVIDDSYILSIVPKLLGSDTIGSIYHSFGKWNHRINTY
jgi:hypothetical protein